MALLKRAASALLRPPTKQLTAKLSTSAPLHHAHSSTIDPSEVSHFNALASTWWDPHGPSRLLHLMNPLRHAFLQQCLASSPRPPTTATSSSLPPQQQPPKNHILDIGCGGGIFAESAARLPSTASVTAIDPSPAVLRVADAHRRRDPLLSDNRLTYLNIPVEDLPAAPQVRPEGYDVVALFEVLEHVARPAPFLEAVLPLVRPGGWVVGSTIARTWASWVVTKVVAEDVLGIVPRGTHDWARYINERELRSWFMERGGWGSPRAMGVVYVPGLGWKEVPGSEDFGNYFFAFRKMPE